MYDDPTLHAFVVQLIRQEADTAHNVFYAVLTRSPENARRLVEDIAEPGDVIVANGGVLSPTTADMLGLDPEEPFRM